MSGPDEDNISFHARVSSRVFDDLLESMVVDVASECHRIARLGLDHNFKEEEDELRLSAEACGRAADPTNSSEVNSKYVADIFGQTHSPVANDIFECMNCGRSIVAGRFAPHLEKCMGKGRKARLKATRSSTAQNRNSRGSLVPTSSLYSASTSIINRPSNGTVGITGEEYSNGSFEEPLTKLE